MRNELFLTWIPRNSQEKISREDRTNYLQRGDMKPHELCGGCRDKQLSRLRVERGDLGAGQGLGAKAARCQHQQRDPILEVTGGGL